MQEVLVDRGEFVLQERVERRDDVGIAVDASFQSVDSDRC
jgi:hypothetical protein